MEAPYNVEAEKALLSALMIDNDSFNRLDELVIQPEDFYADQHKKLFSAMQDLHNQGAAIDLITLGNLLRTRKQLSEVGGDSYLATVSTIELSSAHILHHAKIVKEKSLLRKLITAATTIIQSTQGTSAENIDQVLDEAEKAIFQVTDTGVKASYKPIYEVIKQNLVTLHKLQGKDSAITGVPSGYLDLDRITAGFHPGNLIVVAGRPGMGKSSLAMNFVQNAAIKYKTPAAFFSLEMSNEELGLRILTSEAKISSQKLKVGKVSDEEWMAIANTQARIQNAPLFLDDSPSLTSYDMRTRCRRIKAERGLGIAVVDYLQLMKGTTSFKGGDNREREIAEISRALKALAKELEIPIIALSQLNRGVEARQNKRPMLSDLRESGAIEQDADMVIFVYRDEVYNTDSPDKGTAEVILAKHRAGETGVVKLSWRANYTSFENLSTMEPIY